MSSSGTYDFNPAISDTVLNAFSRIGVRRAALVQEFLETAYLESNLLLNEFSNKQPNLWKSELQEIELLQGVITYDLPPRTLAIQIAYITTEVGGQTTDRVVTPISTVEYGSIPNKETQAPPTVFWFNRQMIPQLKLWTVPDQDDTYTLKLQTLVQVQDANLPSGETLDVPYLWLDAFTAGLAHRLSRHYAPALEQQRKMDAMEAWNVAATQNVENVPLYIIPGLSGYYR